MTHPYPITLKPLLMERPWGGRNLEKELHISLPSNVPIGELWAVVDRPEAQSIVAHGALEGKSLHELWSKERASIFGVKHLGNNSQRFPLLCKILDATQMLSLQVHPSATSATTFHGEPKTEFWYFLKTEPHALCYAGLKEGITREVFLASLKKENVEKTVMALPTQAGDSLFIPSGRLHALGAGNLVIEIQQNSDTTYRVFDWNRRDAEGNARALHLEEAMASIDFNDHEPQLQKKGATISSNYFQTEKWDLSAPHLVSRPDDFAIFTCLTGKAACRGQLYLPGEFFLLPASSEELILTPAAEGTTLLCTRLPA